eukprot:Sdes_comp18127_c0_seq1m7590
MPANLFYSEAPLQSSPNQHHRNQNLIFVGHAFDISNALSSLSQTVRLSQSDSDLFSSLIASTSVPEFSGNSCSMIAKNSAGGFTKIIAILVPTVCSRFNSPFRPDVICEQMGKYTRVDGCKDSDRETAFSRIIVILPDNGNSDFDNALAAGSALARPFYLYSRSGNSFFNTSKHDVSISFFQKNQKSFLATNLSHISAVAHGIRSSARLVDLPPNELHCSAFVQEARQMVERLNNPYVSIKVIEGNELDNQGFGGIFGVGKAAVHPPAFVILEYHPPGIRETMAWVGKGITFDTGGLQIKSKDGMPGMKCDMGGSAMVMCSFEAAVKCGIQFHLYGLLCLAENAVGPIATRPDDIHTLYSGKTVEINNTDAEGRLVLADGVAYASKHLNCDYIIDMATLTGAQGVATGQYFSSIITTDPLLEAKAVAAGKRCGDLVHPLIYCPELFAQEFKSQVADFKNSVKNRFNAQVSCAGQFIANNLVDFSKSWMHIDFAAPVTKGERGTGYGVALLLDLFVFNSVH